MARILGLLSISSLLVTRIGAIFNDETATNEGCAAASSSFAVEVSADGGHACVPQLAVGEVGDETSLLLVSRSVKRSSRAQSSSASGGDSPKDKEQVESVLEVRSDDVSLLSRAFSPMPLLEAMQNRVAWWHQGRPWRRKGVSWITTESHTTSSMSPVDTILVFILVVCIAAFIIILVSGVHEWRGMLARRREADDAEWKRQRNMSMLASSASSDPRSSASPGVAQRFLSSAGSFPAQRGPPPSPFVSQARPSLDAPRMFMDLSNTAVPTTSQSFVLKVPVLEQVVATQASEQIFKVRSATDEPMFFVGIIGPQDLGQDIDEYARLTLAADGTELVMAAFGHPDGTPMCTLYKMEINGNLTPFGYIRNAGPSVVLTSTDGRPMLESSIRPMSGGRSVSIHVGGRPEQELANVRTVSGPAGLEYQATCFASCDLILVVFMLLGVDRLVVRTT